MSISRDTIVASEPKSVYRALLDPDALKSWWGCTTVIEARVGGIWVGGWGRGADNLGQQTVLSATISQLEPDRRVTLKMGEAEVAFQIEPDPQGAKVTVALPGFTAATPEEEESALKSWVDAVRNLKAWAEEHHRFEPPAPEPAPPPAPAQTQLQSQPQLGAQPPPMPSPPGATPSGGIDPFGAAAALAKGDIRVLDDGGFGVTDPHGVIKSWSKEQGFGYVTHPQLGDVVFDYDGCDFEPAPGDEVLLLVIGKRYDGKPKVKRIACLAKGSSIKE